jgi:hypothetical protein
MNSPKHPQNSILPESGGKKRFKIVRYVKKHINTQITMPVIIEYFRNNIDVPRNNSKIHTTTAIS